MQVIHTHYDNLKVGRNAPPKIIREAYKKLSRQYHPDHNPNNPAATRAMQVINLAYDVLSDPVKRKEHDEWIARMEDEHQESLPSSHEAEFKHPEEMRFGFDRKGVFPFGQIYTRQTSYKQQNESFSPGIDKIAIGEHILKHWFWYVLTIAIVIGFGYHSYSKSTYSPFTTSHEQYQMRAKPANGISPQLASDKNTDAPTENSVDPIPNEVLYMRPAIAPNGQSWPATASYLSGYEQSNLSGLSSISIENDRSGSDVMAKLYSLESGTALRVFYIPSLESFKLEKLPPGLYDIRFMDLKNGMLFRTEPFELQESNLANGFRHTAVSMTLYGYSNGHPSLQNLKQEDF